MQTDDRFHRTYYKYNTGNGAGPCVSVQLHGNIAAEYICAYDPVQYHTLFFNTVSDDEKFAVEDECQVGNHGNAHGRQLV